MTSDYSDKLLVHAIGTESADINEALAIGGGTINNFAGGTIDSAQRAITVDDSNLGNAFAATSIYNEGLIDGEDGEAISITDTFADTITNKGTIIGSIATGDGDDTFNLYTGSTVSGAIDGGMGTDTVNLLGVGVGSVSGLTNIEDVRLVGGDWTLGSENANVEFVGASETLRLAPALLADGHFDGTFVGFTPGDVIDLEGIEGATVLGAGNLLTISGGSTSPVTLQFDPAQDFSGLTFRLNHDGTGGTLLSVGRDINGGNGNQTLTGTAGDDLITGGNGNDSISGGGGNDTLSGGHGNDTLTAAAGDDNLDGGNGDDILIAGDGNKSLTGGNGNDILTAGAGNDILSGGNGNDIPTGGAGDDILTGGNGNDTFVFGVGFGHDTVVDFSHGDQIRFTDGTFTNFSAVQAASQQVGTDTVITTSSGASVTLQHVGLNSLHASDFLL